MADPDDTKAIRLPDESPSGRDSPEERRARNAAKMAAARERAQRTIDEARARRQAALEGQLEAHELARAIRAAADGPGDWMSPEQAIAMLAAFGETKH